MIVQAPHRARRIRWATAVVVALALGTTRASAQDEPSEPTPMQRETARRLMDDGDSRRSHGDLAGALESFVAADALVHAPTTGLEVGLTQAQVGQLLEARTTLLDVARSVKTPGEPPQFEQARSQAARASAELVARIPALVVHVRGAGAAEAPELTVDATRIPAAAASAPLRVNPGIHSLVVVVGARTMRASAKVGEGETRDVWLDLPSPTSAAAARAPSLPPVRGAAPPVSMSATSTSWVIPVSFGTAGAGLALGVVAGVAVFVDRGHLAGACPGNTCPPGQALELNAAKSWSTASTIGFAVAAVGVVVGGAVWALDPRSSSAAQWLQHLDGRVSF